MTRSTSTALLLAWGFMFVVQTCRCFTVPAPSSFGRRSLSVVYFQHNDDDGSRQRKRQKILEFVKNSPKHSKKCISILCVSMALWRGVNNIEPAQAARRTTRKEIVVAPAETKKYSPVKGSVVITTGAAAVFTGVRVRKKLSAGSDEETEEGSTMNIPERLSLEQLKKMRTQKIEKVKIEMEETREIEEISLEVENVNIEDRTEMFSPNIEAEHEQVNTTPIVETIKPSLEALDDVEIEELTLKIQKMTPGDENELPEDGPSSTSTPLALIESEEEGFANDEKLHYICTEHSDSVKAEPEVELIKPSSEAEDDTVAGASTSEISPMSETREQPIEEEFLLNEERKQLMEIQAEWDRLMEEVVNTEYPLGGEKFVEARRQPKAAAEEATLAAKYAAIKSLEERAYHILLDLGMIEETVPIDYDMFTAILGLSW